MVSQAIHQHASPTNRPAVTRLGSTTRTALNRSTPSLQSGPPLTEAHGSLWELEETKFSREPSPASLPSVNPTPVLGFPYVYLVILPFIPEPPAQASHLQKPTGKPNSNLFRPFDHIRRAFFDYEPPISRGAFPNFFRPTQCPSTTGLLNSDRKWPKQKC